MFKIREVFKTGLRRTILKERLLLAPVVVKTANICCFVDYVKEMLQRATRGAQLFVLIQPISLICGFVAAMKPY